MRWLAHPFERHADDDRGGCDAEVGQPFEMRPDQGGVADGREEIAKRIRNLTLRFEYEYRWSHAGSPVMRGQDPPLIKSGAVQLSSIVMANCNADWVFALDLQFVSGNSGK